MRSCQELVGVLSPVNLEGLHQGCLVKMFRYKYNVIEVLSGDQSLGEVFSHTHSLGEDFSHNQCVGEVFSDNQSVGEVSGHD